MSSFFSDFLIVMVAIGGAAVNVEVISIAR